MLEFGIGLGWLGWECQNYLWTARAGTAPVTPQGSCRAGEGNSCSRHTWEHPRAAAAHLQAAKTWGKVLQKKSFSARGSGSVPSSWPRNIWGFPAEGLDTAP